MKRPLLLPALLSSCLALGGCGLLIGHAIREGTRANEQESQVNASLERYRKLTLAQDIDRVADMFTPVGELSEGSDKPLVGQEQIRSFLKGLGTYRIQDYSLNATSTKLESGEVTQLGTYSQAVTTPIGTVVNAAGSFEAKWQRQSDGRWLLTRMHTSRPRMTE